MGRQKYLIVFSGLLLLINFSLGLTPSETANAQDAVSTSTVSEEITQPVTETAEPDAPDIEPTLPIETPVESVPTDEQTVEPTLPAPPTQEITPDVTQEATPEATLELTPEATSELTEVATEVLTEPVSNQPPIFTIDQSSFDVIPGIPLTFQATVSDNTPTVNITTDTTGTRGGLNIITIATTETSAPFTTTVDVTYLPPADFIGVDNFTLTATDEAGASASVIFSVNINSVEVTPEATEEPIPTEELIINYRVGMSEEAIQTMLDALNAEEVLRIPEIGGMLVHVPAELSSPREAIQALQTDAEAVQAGVITIEENGIDQLFGFVPNDPSLGIQWGLSDDLPGMAVYNDDLPDAMGAWDFSNKRGSGVTVAVLDSGIDLTHPEFAGKIVPGWDFIGDDNEPTDGVGHGTHVAGIIAARANNGAGIAGVAFNARIMPVKICDFIGCPRIYQAAGIVYAVDKGAKVINMSLGGCSGPTTIVQGAVEYALSRGVVIVASAGNGGGQSGCASANNVFSYPASYDGVISVTGHNYSGSSGFDAQGFNINNRILVSAPGISIYSTVPVNQGTYASQTGTSMAAPHVSGLVALLISGKIAKTPAEVREALICSAVDFDPTTNLPGSDGYDNEYGYGVVQADFAMRWSSIAGCQRPQLNDSFVNATAVRRVPTTITQSVDTRSVTTQSLDPQICGVTREQTLWYSFKAPSSGYYQITTDGSTDEFYDTVIGVYRGNPGALIQLACDDNSGYGNASALLVDLERGQTYYIAVGTFDDVPLASNDMLRLDIRQALNRFDFVHQENAVQFDYSGLWSYVKIVGAQGNRVKQNLTPALGDFVNFSFRGTTLDFYKAAGGDDVDIYVDGALLMDNFSASETFLNLNVGGNSGEYHQVHIRANAGGQFGIDAVVPRDATEITSARVIGSIVDDALTTYLTHQGTWTIGDISPITSFQNTYSYTSTNGDSLTFRMRGNGVMINRFVDATYGNMDVYIDGIFHETVSNISPNFAVSPYFIGGLTKAEHTIQLMKVSGSLLAIDSVRTLNQRAMTANGSQIDERHSSVSYSGVWTESTDLNSFRQTLLSTSDIEAEAQFVFMGNAFCISVQAGGSNLDVFVDNTLAFNISGAGEWCSDEELDGSVNYPSGLLYTGFHHIRLEINSPVTLDYFRAQKISVLVPENKLIQERDSRVTSSNPLDWLICSSTCARSANGYRAQGGRSQRAYVTFADKSFYINGSGFLLYTSTGSGAGGWIIFVDGIPLSIVNGGALPTVTINSTSYPVIDMQGTLASPIAIGVTGLGPGIHKVTIRTVVPELGGEYVEFDGIRVIP